MKQVRVAIAGLGTVGAAVFNMLKTHPSFEVTAVSARSKSKDRGVDMSGVSWVDNVVDLATRDDVDVVVEVMGGDGDPALPLVRTALSNNKHVVTANKALLAKHGVELAKLAEQNAVSLSYEAAVAGGIPIIKMLREGLSANDIDAVYGILNGTCNYILTTMEDTGRGFADVLSEAQTLGYAEADPTLDIDGGDTGHKLALLTALVFGAKPDFKSLSIQGVRSVSIEDIHAAGELNHRIKLIGLAQIQKTGRVLQMVTPALVPKSSPMAHVDGVLNGVLTIGNYVGQSFVSGRGAGAQPTASAIVADLIDIVRGSFTPVFGKPAAQLLDKESLDMSDWRGEFYMRLVVKDRVGVIADIAPILRDAYISIESMIQHGRSSGDKPISVVIVTHATSGRHMMDAVQKITKLDSMVASPFVMPILKI